jgi:hypothetical protein
MDKKRILPLFLLILNLFTINCKKDASQNDGETKASSDQEIENIRLSSISFYKWYLKELNDDTPFNYETNVIEGRDGKCVLDLEPYFKELRNLKTISEKFISKENERLSDCSGYLSTIDFNEYDSADFDDEADDSFAGYCPNFNYYFWIRSQESYQDCSSKNIQLTSDKTATADIFFSFKDSKEETSPLSRVYLEKENNEWKMVDIKILNKKLRPKAEKIDIHNSWTNNVVSIDINSNQIAILYHGQCAGFYPMKILSKNEVELIWANEMDCVFNVGTDNDYGLANAPAVGKPFAKYTLKGKILHAEYYYKEWVKKYAGNTNADVFTSKYYLKTDN